MSKTATASVANEVLRLAKIHHITAARDSISHMAMTITRLSGDAVELDNIEQLLINLKRRGILSKPEILALQGRYLQEKRRAKQQQSA